MTQFYYRLDDRPDVVLTKFQVLKHTRKGVWLKTYGGKRFVLHSARKRFADPTEERALESFRARKKRQQDIYWARAKQAEEAVRKAELKINRIMHGTYSLLDV